MGRMALLLLKPLIYRIITTSCRYEVSRTTKQYSANNSRVCVCWGGGVVCCLVISIYGVIQLELTIVHSVTTEWSCTHNLRHLQFIFVPWYFPKICWVFIAAWSQLSFDSPSIISQCLSQVCRWRKRSNCWSLLISSCVDVSVDNGASVIQGWNSGTHLKCPMNLNKSGLEIQVLSSIFQICFNWKEGRSQGERKKQGFEWQRRSGS